MKALVVFESMFGNSEIVAGAIAVGLARHVQTSVVEVSEAGPLVPSDVDLLVVGGPTHTFSMSRPQTRADAVRQGAPATTTTRGVREWLEGLPSGHEGTFVAHFDTKADKVRRLSGSAARHASKLTVRRGYRKAVRPESFYVEGTPGPLVAGEVERATQWGDVLGSQLAAGFRHSGLHMKDE